MRTLSLAALLIATGCSVIPGEAYFNRGTPESLLDVSSEVVNFTIDSDPSLDEMSQWVNQDQPSRAELYCTDGDRMCEEAKNVLNQFGVPFTVTPGGDGSVVLVYERVMARDCENRYIDNHINPYELNHPTFGCSVAANMVQMISDKRQLTSPNLLDYTDANKARQTMDSYNEPTVSQKQLKIDTNWEPLVVKNLVN